MRCLFQVVLLNYCPQQARFLDFAYCYPKCSKMRLVVQACCKNLLMFMSIFLILVLTEHLGVRQSKMLCKRLATLY